MLAYIVDDDEDNRFICEKTLTSLGFVCQTFENGLEALHAASLTMPHLVLLDWNMPEMNGPDFVEAFRNLPGSNKANVIMCTGENDKSKVVQMVNNGVKGYIVKPFSKATLVDQISKLGLLSQMRKEAPVA